MPRASRGVYLYQQLLRLSHEEERLRSTLRTKFYAWSLSDKYNVSVLQPTSDMFVWSWISRYVKSRLVYYLIVLMFKIVTIRMSMNSHAGRCIAKDNVSVKQPSLASFRVFAIPYLFVLYIDLFLLYQFRIFKHRCTSVNWIWCCSFNLTLVINSCS